MAANIKKLRRSEGVVTALPSDLAIQVYRYQKIFNATTDWGTAAGGYYTITVTAATHQCGLIPLISVFKLNGSNYEKFLADTELFVAADGNVSIKTPETPNTRFAGQLIIY
jgi:hypothetical protein